jgi:glycolate oxidase FAD binding subunit
MGETFEPKTPEQVLEAIVWAVDAESPLEIIGAGTKRTIGPASTADHLLNLSGLVGIQSHEPEELVLTAAPGTTLTEIEGALLQNRQQLAFEPPDLGPLLGQDPELGTLGASVACNLSGPRRIKAGAARDHLLGFKAVSGRGESFKAGGKVVKNVTGYDLCKLMCGSWGTLAVMTELSVKVLPAPDRTRTVLVFGCSMDRAGLAMTQALQSPYEVSGAAHLPIAATEKSRIGLVAKGGDTVTAIRVEGNGASVDYRCDKLRGDLAEFGETEELHSANSHRFWSEIRDVSPFAGKGDQRAIWKLSVPPSLGPILAAGLVDEVKGEVFLDWGGGLIWLALENGADAGATIVRGAIRPSGGHATLIRASEQVRTAVKVFEPPSWLALAHRIKEGFDPKSILNPGRLVGGV